MSEEEKITIARVEQKLDDLSASFKTFSDDFKPWKAEVDNDRNRAKGALVAVTALSGLLGTVFAYIGRHIRL